MGWWSNWRDLYLRLSQVDGGSWWLRFLEELCGIQWMQIQQILPEYSLKISLLPFGSLLLRALAWIDRTDSENDTSAVNLSIVNLHHVIETFIKWSSEDLGFTWEWSVEGENGFGGIWQNFNSRHLYIIVPNDVLNQKHQIPTVRVSGAILSEEMENINWNLNIIRATVVPNCLEKHMIFEVSKPYSISLHPLPTPQKCLNHFISRRKAFRKIEGKNITHTFIVT